MDNTEIQLKKGVLSLAPLSGLLGYSKAKHLLNRSLFGAKLSEIQFIQDKTAEEAVGFLLNDSLEKMGPPLSVDEDDLEIPLGTTWVNTKYNSKYRNERIYSYKNWWMRRLYNIELSLKEKMVFFWHNHFALENDIVRNTNFNYKYNILLTKHALGNFKIFTEEMTVNVGMLKYLDGDENKMGSANENYARELFELFTIGKGPLIDEGNYTNYNEHDIQEAAKVLTGWKTDSDTDSAYFSSSRHDKTDKIFSDLFENFTITNDEENEYKKLINMIFLQKETARYLVRKIYRYFVYHHIDEEIKQNIIEPLATLFISSNFEIKPVLQMLLSSEHFFDENLQGCMIKNPLELNVGLLRQLEYDIPDSSDLKIQYGFWQQIRALGKLQDLELGDPPDVAGWPAWYRAPLYNQVWINTATIPIRYSYIKKIINSSVIPYSKAEKLYFDPFKIAYSTPDPSSINVLVPTLANLLFPQTASEELIAELKEILNPGLPDFEWTVEWNKYVENPGDENQKKVIGKQMKDLLLYMCSMAEFQLI